MMPFPMDNDCSSRGERVNAQASGAVGTDRNVPVADRTSSKRSGFTMNSIRPLTVAISAAALLTIAACGGTTTSPSASSSSSSSSSSSASESASGPAGPATIKVATTSLGKVLSDDQGRVLYMFDADKDGDSTCYDQCAAAWPPLLTAGAPKAGDGTDDGLLGTTNRTDGTTQVTYNKLPLYYFTPDKAPGDVKGQGVKTVWWVVSADGKVIKTAP